MIYVKNPVSRKIMFCMLLCMSFLSMNTKAQLPATIEDCVNILNAKAKDVAGVIKIMDKSRFVVDDNAVEMEKGILKIIFTVGKTQHYYAFDPADIFTVTDGNSITESPVGTIKINFLSHRVANYNIERDDIKESKYVQTAYFNYLKKDRTSFETIKKTLDKLTEIRKGQETDAVNHLLKQHLNNNPEFWVSGNKESTTFTLYKAFFSGQALHLFYDADKVTLSGNTKGSFLTIVPLQNIARLVLDKKSSKPGSFFLEANRDGFPLYKRGSTNASEYLLQEKTTESVPLFIGTNLLKSENDQLIIADMEKLLLEYGIKRLKVETRD